MAQQYINIANKTSGDLFTASEFNDIKSVVNVNATDTTSSLASKADLSHTHSISNITDLQTELDNKQATLTTASQAEMEAGTETHIRSMSPQNVKQAIDAIGGSGGTGSITNSITQGDSGVTVTDAGSDGNIEFKTENTVRWNINSSGHLILIVIQTLISVKLKTKFVTYI